MKLVIIRHGQAEASSPDDLRPLTPQGIETIQKLARSINPIELKSINHIWHSTLVRAKETATIFQSISAPSAELKTVEFLAPSSGVDPICEEIRHMREDLAIVGHNPHLSELASYLLTNSLSQNLINLQPGSILCLERIEISSELYPLGIWSIKWYLSPNVITESVQHNLSL